MRLSLRDAVGVLSILQRDYGLCNHTRTGNGHLMNALLLLRSHLGTAFALGAVLLTALTLIALRLSFPAEVPGLELLLFGWIGVALGRLTIGARSSESNAAKGSPGTAEKVDQILRSVARLLQTHLSESDAFSERARHPSACVRV
jgi:hypothetical protein